MPDEDEASNGSRGRAAKPSKRMRLRYAGTCRICAQPLPAGTQATYYPDLRQVECDPCSTPAQSSAVGAESVTVNLEAAQDHAPLEAEPGIAGKSARREYERRVAKREETIQTAHPRIGGFLLAVSDEPQSTEAWKGGAVGEELLARRLNGLSEQGVRLLHDRRIPKSKADIDHIAVTPTGIYVIDAKRYRGRPHLRVEGGILRPRVEKLLVGTRDCTSLVAGVQKQLELVRGVLTAAGHEVPAQGMLCFVDADWPLIGGAFTIADVAVLWPKEAAKRLATPGPVDVGTIDQVHADVALRFPSA